MFSIEILDRALNACDESELSGQLTIDGYEEVFCISTDYWQPRRYQEQWREAAELIVSSSVAKTAFITNALDPGLANFLVWWPAYRVGEEVWLGNALVWHEDYDLALVLGDTPAAVPDLHDYWTDAGDGTPSKWIVDIRSVEDYIVRSGRGHG